MMVLYASRITSTLRLLRHNLVALGRAVKKKHSEPIAQRENPKSALARKSFPNYHRKVSKKFVAL